MDGRRLRLRKRSLECDGLFHEFSLSRHHFHKIMRLCYPYEHPRQGLKSHRSAPIEKNINLHSTAAVRFRTLNPEDQKLKRAEWDPLHPTLISEALFAIANIFSFMRLSKYLKKIPSI